MKGMNLLTTVVICVLLPLSLPAQVGKKGEVKPVPKTTTTVKTTTSVPTRRSTSAKRRGRPNSTGDKARLELMAEDRITESTYIKVRKIPPVRGARRFELLDMSFAEERGYLHYYADQLLNERTSQGYILVYAARTGPAGQAQFIADRAKDYLVNTQGVDTHRVVTIDGGCREILTEQLWIVPQGMPGLESDVFSTVPCEPKVTIRRQ
jgi:hypothetical protein